jgi:hypothetical protein
LVTAQALSNPQSPVVGDGVVQTYSFSLPLTSISDGSVATVVFEEIQPNGQRFAGPFSIEYTQTQIPSIYYTSTTTTIINTTQVQTRKIGF